ncbi:amidohydrolase family protein [Microbacterium sp. MEC084]|uniref:amidohydrolase n=1 Tax=unclassified Microbacterium TaxID=2609290 RepID=UPI0006F8F5AD|nr:MULTISPECIES: amidohydrolase family protein [unclassified Microbacterium]KQZ03693.1 hypothetical protein ASD19_13575 [Microbacterium sp. Root53]MCD1269909.1 amidohydrolase family protein [Microbacterium sp. MEC084]
MQKTEYVVRGTIRTMGPHGVVEALHVRGSQIAAVGDAGLADELISRGVPVIDVPRDGAALPAFVDPHVHLTQYAVATARGVDCRVPRCTGIADVTDALRDRARETPEGEWVIGYGNLFFDQKLAERRFPTRSELDAVSTRHPIVIHCGGHVSILNTAALRAARVERFLQAGMGLWGSPVVGVDNDGNPSGYVAEVDGHLPIPAPSREETTAWVRERYAADYLANGVVTVGEMLESDAQLGALEGLAADESAACRVALYAIAPGFRPVDEAFDWVAGFTGSPGRLWAQGVKMFVDGGYSARNAASLQPYSPDHSPRPGYRGRLNKSRDELLHAFGLAAERDIQVALHTNGTRAQAEVLKALSAFPHRIDVRVEHLGNVLEDVADIDAWKATGVVPVLQPGFLSNFIGDYLPMLFPGHGVNGRVPLRTILDAAVAPAFSSDVAVGGDIDATNPWHTIWSAVARRSFWDVEVEPTEAISVEEALRAHTLDAARALGASDRLGSLEAGKEADLVIVGRDPVHSSTDGIAATETLAVHRAGVEVFTAGKAGE